MTTLKALPISPLRLMAICSVSALPAMGLVGYMLYIQHSRPHISDAAAGFVKPFTFRGGVTYYLSQADFVVMGGLFALAFAAVGGVQLYLWRLRKQAQLEGASRPR
jgi:hypothetical protein